MAFDLLAFDLLKCNLVFLISWVYSFLSWNLRFSFLCQKTQTIYSVSSVFLVGFIRVPPQVASCERVHVIQILRPMPPKMFVLYLWRLCFLSSNDVNEKSDAILNWIHYIKQFCSLVSLEAFTSCYLSSVFWNITRIFLVSLFSSIRAYSRTVLQRDSKVICSGFFSFSWVQHSVCT